jgi:PIN domain nuclease of toxin-antitoxin system
MGGRVRLLLDTHALLWWFTDDEQLSAKARELILDEGNEILVSAASAWEVSTKFRIGKLPELTDLLSRFDELVAADGFVHLAVNYRHALRAGAYAMPHRDPFDRMLAAQSELERVPLVTLDAAFAHFPVQCIW